jgi:phospholipid/cholesterol/gamma-HCH transport system permease protein
VEGLGRLEFNSCKYGDSIHACLVGYDSPMMPSSSFLAITHRWLGAWSEWLRGWWQILYIGAQLMVLAFSPSSYRPSQRKVLAAKLYAATAPILISYVLISALICLVVTRIIVTTALTYGLSHYALDVLIRTLVLELLPLSVALVVAVRFTMPEGKLVRDMRERGEFAAQWRAGGDPTRDELLPRVIAGVFSVLILAMLSGFVALVLAYLSVYGFHTWGFSGYTRSVGQVFNPVVALVFSLKTIFFSLAVSVIPIVFRPRAESNDPTGANAEIKVLARLFTVILLIEVLALVGNYY